MAKEKVIPTFKRERFDDNIGKRIEEEVEIYVGMPCTFGVGSDSYPAHVSRISESGKTVWIKRATVVGADEGHDYFGSQKWIIEPNDDASEQRLYKDKYGNWRLNKYSAVGFGRARYYQDPHF